MKKILSVTLCILILAGVFSLPVSAYERPSGKLEWTFIEDEEIISACKESFLEFIPPEEIDFNLSLIELPMLVYCTQDEATIFFAATHASPVETSQIIGRYIFFNYNLYGKEYKNPIGLYAMKNNGECMHLIDAYEKGLVDLEDFAAHYPDHYRLTDAEYACVTRLNLPVQSWGWAYESWEQVYEYIPSTGDESAFGYAVCHALEDIEHKETVIEYFGDYTVVSPYHYTPDPLAYYVYLPESDGLVPLREAFENRVEGIERFFTEANVPAGLMGDRDGDEKLTVKDATTIQKSLVGLNSPSLIENDLLLEAVTDFDRDGKATVRDATAIQKKIAGF